MRYLFIILLFTFIGCETNKSTENKLFEFDLRWFALKDKADCKMEKSSQFEKEVLLFQSAGENSRIIISGIGSKIDWSRAKYLICDVYDPNDSSVIIRFDFYGKKAKEETGVPERSPAISPEIKVLPFIKTKIVLPLSFLDGQKVSIESIPGKPAVFDPGSSLDPKDVGIVHLRLLNSSSQPYPPELEIAAIYLSNAMPENPENPAGKR